MPFFYGGWWSWNWKLRACVCVSVWQQLRQTLFYMYFLSPCIVLSLLSLEKSTALSVSKGIRGKGRGGHNSQLSHGHMGSTEREREIEKNSTALLLLLITGQRYCQGLFLCSFLFSLLKKFVLTSQKNKKIIRRTLKALLDTIKHALIG